MDKHLVSLLAISALTLTSGEGHLTCPYGFQFHVDRKSCVVSCEGEKNTSRPNVHCEIYQQNEIARVPPFQPIMNPHPACYNISLTSNQYSTTADGKYQLHSKVPPLLSHNVLHSTGSDTLSTCIPLSPQLLQCETVTTQPGDYQLINGTELLILSSNLSHYLGDFYITSNGSAVSCPQSIQKSLYIYPRCRYVNVGPSDYLIHPNGSLSITKANLLIKQPVYSYKNNGSDVMRVCVPLDAQFINCKKKTSVLAFNYDINEDLTAKNYLMNEVVKADNYFIKKGSWMAVCVEDKWYRENHNDITIKSLQMYLYMLSAFCLIITFIVKFKSFAENYITKCLLSHMVCLSLLYTGTAIRHLTISKLSLPLCYVVYAITYYFHMAAFFWLSVMAYDSMRNFLLLPTSPPKLRNGLGAILCPNTSDKQRFVAYNVYAWVSAAILTATTLCVDLSPMPSDIGFLNPQLSLACWFNNAQANYVYFYAPLITLIIINIALFGITIYIINHMGKGTKMVNNKRKMQTFKVGIKLFILLGLSWSLDIIYYNIRFLDTSWNFKFWYISRTLGGLQGVAILLVYLVDQNHIQIIKSFIIGLHK